ncbi:hypothetical protein OESDEN_25609, partial [Oesophagostomum dentatum]
FFSKDSLVSSGATVGPVEVYNFPSELAYFLSPSLLPGSTHRKIPVLPHLNKDHVSIRKNSFFLICFCILVSSLFCGLFSYKFFYMFLGPLSVEKVHKIFFSKRAWHPFTNLFLRVFILNIYNLS